MSLKNTVVFQQAFCIILWIIAVYLFMAFDFWYAVAFLLASHIFELIVTAYSRGTKAGYTVVETITLTFVYGATWWLYLGKA